MLDDIKWELYKLALWYIRKCDKKDDCKYELEKLSKEKRLTYRNDGKAYLKYGLDRNWNYFRRYKIIENAVEKLAEYEDEPDKKYREVIITEIMNELDEYYSQQEENKFTDDKSKHLILMVIENCKNIVYKHKDI